MCFDGDYFHSLSGDTVDTYTSRVLSSVISRRNTTNGKIEGSDWISLVSPAIIIIVTNLLYVPSLAHLPPWN